MQAVEVHFDINFAHLCPHKPDPDQQEDQMEIDVNEKAFKQKDYDEQCLKILSYV